MIMYNEIVVNMIRPKMFNTGENYKIKQLKLKIQLL
jgi:hypothetical protein